MPCKLRFKGQLKDVLKLKKLLTPARTKSGANDEPVIKQPSKEERETWTLLSLMMRR